MTIFKFVLFSQIIKIRKILIKTILLLVKIKINYYTQHYFFLTRISFFSYILKYFIPLCGKELEILKTINILKKNKKEKLFQCTKPLKWLSLFFEQYKNND